MARRLLIVLMVVGFWGGAASGPSWAKSPDAAKNAVPAEQRDQYYELYKMLADTMDQVERNYVQELDRRELIEAAIQGVVNRLDPYSSYIKPEELESFRTSVDAQFGGIGIQITLEAGTLTVLSPLVDTPAYRAGVRAGDRIVEIEGKSTEGLSLTDAVKRLKGPTGSSVTITIVHADSEKPKVVKINRELIHVKTVLGDRRKSDDSWDFVYDRDRQIGYVRISAFSRDTAKDLRGVLERLTKEKLRGLVLDLRFNPGGLLSSAIEISDLFISSGSIVSTEGRNTKKRVWNAHPEGTFEGFPMAVLVNRYSASASEILSACLQDHNRAVIVGERTWGKGSVQNVIELEDGRSALKLTTASYQRPSGKNIHRFPDADESADWGVKPNQGFELKLSEQEMARLIQDRRQRDIVIFHGDAEKEIVEGAPPEPELEEGAPPEPELADEPGTADDETPMVDRQLQKAIDYLSQELARAE